MSFRTDNIYEQAKLHSTKRQISSSSKKHSLIGVSCITAIALSICYSDQARSADDRQSDCREIHYLIDTHRYDEAIAFADSHLRKEPDDARLLGEKATAEWYLKKMDATIADATRAVKIEPKLAIGWLMRSMGLASKNELHEALRSADKAAVLMPESSAAWVNKAKILAQLHRFDEALANYDKAIKTHDAGLSYAYSCKGQLLVEQDRLKEGIDCLDKSLQLNNSDDDRRRIRIAACTKMHDWQRVVDDSTYLYARAHSLESKIGLLGMRADAQMHMHDMQRAIKDMHSAIELVPDKQKLHELLMKAYQQRDDKTALTDQQKLLRAVDEQLRLSAPVKPN